MYIVGKQQQARAAIMWLKHTKDKVLTGGQFDV
jgi:hypothetical protein